ncbi:Flavin monooxygenase FMO [Macleaya cordata]|uniref:Flavin-containing monooxygenase n=1 Tax=Macleaya cordata TaxID=56857 RepID=A0A200PZ27_MACCD|nr:Flavin monooxygenase FMO [Macleaya cordata]
MAMASQILPIFAMNPLIPSNFTSRKVAVIGAGAAGLVAARELRREGHEAVVFERSDRVGGTWVYDPNVEPDPIGLDSSRTIVHSSLYESLRTNLPREIMGFRDYPFVVGKDDGKKQRDPRRFPGHREVLNYLEDFVNDFQLNELIRFETEVVHVGLVLVEDERKKWVVKYRRRMRGGDVDEVFDGVVVCNGHYTKPNIAEIPGIDAWPGKQIHSHNYRVPEPFRDQVVVSIGASASGQDISRDIARVAKEVHIASRSATNGLPMKQPGYDNMWLHSMIESAHEDGTIVFQDGSSVIVDVILHCTGYKYYFPFLETNNIVTVDDNRVGPLYKHVFPPLLAPGLSFIGLPWKVIPFPLSELQSKWVAGVLSGRILLPSQEKMLEDVEAFYLKLEAAGVPKRYTHNMADYQFEYNDWLAAECGCPPTEKWRKQMYEEASKKKKTQPETYRDEWEDQQLILQAQEDFRQYLPAELQEHANKT